MLDRGMDRFARLVLPAFQPGLHRSSEAYSGGVKRVISRRLGDVADVALIGVTYGLFSRPCPGGFVPGQDKQYLVGFAQLPDGATLDRTEEVIRAWAISR